MTKLVRFSLTVTVVSITYFALASRVRYVHAEQSRPFDVYTAQQIIRRTEPLCRALVHQPGCFSLTADRFTTGSSTGTIRRFWTVDCTGQDEKYIAQFTWNADTGDLCGAVHIRSRLRSAQPLLGRDSAIRAAATWLHTLGKAGQAKHWRLAFPAHLVDARWHVVMKATGAVVRIWIDARTGDLSSANSLRFPSKSKS